MNNEPLTTLLVLAEVVGFAVLFGGLCRSSLNDQEFMAKSTAYKVIWSFLAFTGSIFWFPTVLGFILMREIRKPV